MLNSQVLQKRREISRTFKACREAYGFSLTDVHKQSNLSTETIYRIELGFKPWSIDSELSYIRALEALVENLKTEKHKLWVSMKLPEVCAFLKTHRHEVS